MILASIQNTSKGIQPFIYYNISECTVIDRVAKESPLRFQTFQDDEIEGARNWCRKHYELMTENGNGPSPDIPHVRDVE